MILRQADATANTGGTSSSSDRDQKAPAPLTLEKIEEITKQTKEKHGDQAAAAEARGLMDA